MADGYYTLSHTDIDILGPTEALLVSWLYNKLRQQEESLSQLVLSWNTFEQLASWLRLTKSDMALAFEALVLHQYIKSYDIQLDPVKQILIAVNSSQFQHQHTLNDIKPESRSDVIIQATYIDGVDEIKDNPVYTSHQKKQSQQSLPTQDKKVDLYQHSSNTPRDSIRVNAVTWQPSKACLADLKQHGVSGKMLFQLSEIFKTIYSEDYNTLNDEHVFFQFCLKEYQKLYPASLPKSWHPSSWIIQTLQDRGVTPAFIRHSLPEFILVINERGLTVAHPDGDFFRFTYKRWRKQVNTLDEDSDLRALPENWQPNQAVHSYLRKQGVTEQQVALHLISFYSYASEYVKFSQNWSREFIHYCSRFH